MTLEGPLWIGDQEAADLLSLGDAIDVLDATYRLQGRGEAATMGRAHVRDGETILHAVGGAIGGQRIAGTKSWVYSPGGAQPLLALFSLADGRMLGLVEAFALGQRRTAATSGLATRVLAREDARTLALLGTGKQAFAQAQAVASVRPIERVRLFGRDPGRRADLAARLRATLEVEVSEHATTSEAVASADVVTAITRSAEPVLAGADLAEGMHVNAVGAIVPVRRELDERAVGRADLVVVDSVAQARDDAGELRAAAEAGVLDWTNVQGLDAVVDETPAGLRRPTDITLFKALGVGLSDVALGAEVLRRALNAGAGLVLPARRAAH